MFRVLAVACAVVGLSSELAAAEAWQMYAEGPMDYTLLEGDEVYLRVGIAAWGPSWKWFGFGGEATADAQGRRIFKQRTAIGGTDKQIEIEHEAVRKNGTGVVLGSIAFGVGVATRKLRGQR